MGKKNSKNAVLSMVENINKKDDAFKVNSFNRNSSVFTGYPVESVNFNDALNCSITANIARLNELERMQKSREKLDTAKKALKAYENSLSIYESLSDDIKKALNVKMPIKPGFNVNPVVTTIKTNTKRNLNRIFQAIVSGDKSQLTESESKYSGQLKSIYTALQGKGSGLLNEALKGRLNDSLEVKLQGLTVINDRFQNQFNLEAQKESEKIGLPVTPKQATFYRNNAPYVKVIHAMVIASK